MTTQKWNKNELRFRSDHYPKKEKKEIHFFGP